MTRVGDSPRVTMTRVGDSPRVTMTRVGDSPRVTMKRVGDSPRVTMKRVGENGLQSALMLGIKIFQKIFKKYSTFLKHCNIQSHFTNSMSNNMSECTKRQIELCSRNEILMIDWLVLSQSSCLPVFVADDTMKPCSTELALTRFTNIGLGQSVKQPNRQQVCVGTSHDPPSLGSSVSFRHQLAAMPSRPNGVWLPSLDSRRFVRHNPIPLGCEHDKSFTALISEAQSVVAVNEDWLFSLPVVSSFRNVLHKCCHPSGKCGRLNKIKRHAIL